jgi:hypothetical protein
LTRVRDASHDARAPLRGDEDDIVSKKSRKLGIGALVAVCFGFALSLSATAGGSCDQCWRTCEIEYAECMQVVGNEYTCGTTYRSCGISCGCEIP